jgi:hypothetical protein
MITGKRNHITRRETNTQCHSVHHKSHINCPDIEWKEATLELHDLHIEFQDQDHDHTYTHTHKPHSVIWIYAVPFEIQLKLGEKCLYLERAGPVIDVSSL